MTILDHISDESTVDQHILFHILDHTNNAPPIQIQQLSQQNQRN